jgi:toxin-antitoxin system PIN domain toxin
MIIPDANLLLYAYDSSSPFHERAANWWSQCLSGSEPVGLCGVVLSAFVRISTSRRAFESPMAIAEAAGHVRSWLQRSVTELLVLEESDLLRAMEFLEAQGSGATLTTDAQIAAVAVRCRATVHTADTDFQRFPRLRWANPLR